jgi:hypothetical protein
MFVRETKNVLYTICNVPARRINWSDWQRAGQGRAGQARRSLVPSMTGVILIATKSRSDLTPTQPLSNG